MRFPGWPRNPLYFARWFPAYWPALSSMRRMLTTNVCIAAIDGTVFGQNALYSSIEAVTNAGAGNRLLALLIQVAHVFHAVWLVPGSWQPYHWNRSVNACPGSPDSAFQLSIQTMEAQ